MADRSKEKDEFVSDLMQKLNEVSRLIRFCQPAVGINHEFAFDEEFHSELMKIADDTDEKGKRIQQLYNQLHN